MNKCSLTRSWVDHCLCTKTVRCAVTGVSIDYTDFGSDRSLMMVTIKLEMSPITTPYENISSKIKWDLNNDDKA